MLRPDVPSALSSEWKMSVRAAVFCRVENENVPPSAAIGPLGGAAMPFWRGIGAGVAPSCVDTETTVLTFPRLESRAPTYPRTDCTADTVAGAGGVKEEGDMTSLLA